MNELDNVRSRIQVLTPGNTGWTREELAGLPALGSASVAAVDRSTSDDYFAIVQDYVTPMTLSLGTAGAKLPTF